MALFIKVGSSWEPSNLLAAHVAGVWQPAIKAWLKVAGVWRQFFGPLAVSQDTTAANASGSAGSLTTNTVTAIPSFGAPGYTYQWEFVSGDAGPQATAGLMATTAWWAISGPSTTLNAVWRCKVTDMAGNIAYSSDIAITMTFT